MDMDRERKHVKQLLENAVAKKDTCLIKKYLLKAEQYEFRFLFLEASLTQAAAAGNVDVVQLLLDHVESDDVAHGLWVVFCAAAKYFTKLNGKAQRMYVNFVSIKYEEVLS